MRVRKIAKQIKRFHQGNVCWDKENDVPVYTYKIGCHDDKVHYIIRMTRKHYFGLAKKHNPNSMMGKLYIHKACSPYLYEDILSFWGMEIY